MPTNLTAADISKGVEVIAEQIARCNPDGGFVLVGVRSRGDEVASRILEQLSALGLEVPIGILDISLYRDDLAHLNSNPKLQGSDLPFAVDKAKIILVDDVLFTGRTVRAAIDAIMDYGRPSQIELAVLIDRGHRELPFAPNYVGIQLETHRLDYVDVKLEITDGIDFVEITKNKNV